MEVLRITKACEAGEEVSVMRVAIPMIPPSANVLRRKYKHPMAYKRLREAWERSLLYACGSAAACQELRRQADESRMRVLVTIFHAREFDSDNAVAGLKPVLDALKNLHFIKDDNLKWLDLRPVEQCHSRSEWQTVIEIEKAA